MKNQMYPYLNQIFSKYQYGFRKGYNAQHCIMAMIEKWHKFLDIRGHAGALLTDLSKAFDSMDHKSLIAKLILHIVHWLKSCLVYLSDQFFGHYYLMLTYVIFFMILMI